MSKMFLLLPLIAILYLALTIYFGAAQQVSARILTCGGRSYDTSSDQCCGGNIIPLTNRCCGTGSCGTQTYAYYCIAGYSCSSVSGIIGTDTGYVCILDSCPTGQQRCGNNCISNSSNCCRQYTQYEGSCVYGYYGRWCDNGETCLANPSAPAGYACIAPPPTCSGTATLTLTPSTVAPGQSVTPSVATSSLANCSGTISFKSNSCSGTQVSSCTIASGGCSGGAFTAPVTAGAHTYYACPPTGATSGSASLTVASPLIFGMTLKRRVAGVVFEDTDLDGIKGATETCPNLAATLTATDTGTGVSIQYPSFNTWVAGGGFVPAGCSPYYLILPSQKQHTIILSSLLNPSGVSVINSYTIQPSTGFTVTLDSITLANCRASPSPAACNADTGHINSANFALQPPPPGTTLLPWIQTFGGDVHSNTRIHTPGGP